MNCKHALYVLSYLNLGLFFLLGAPLDIKDAISRKTKFAEQSDFKKENNAMNRLGGTTSNNPIPASPQAILSSFKVNVHPQNQASNENGSHLGLVVS